MSDFKIIFIHGYTASSEADWYPTISPALKELNVDFAIPDLPGDREPHSGEWLEIIHQEFVKSDKPVVLVGHSLGTRAALLFLEKYREYVKAVFLFGAFANRTENAYREDADGEEKYPDFFEDKIDLDKIKDLSEKFVVVHSEDDFSIEYEQAVEIAKDLSAKLITFQDKGHFTLPEHAQTVLEVLQKELDF